MSRNRSRGPSMQDILATDQNPVPEVLRRESSVDLGLDGLDTDRYTTAAFHRREVDEVWGRVWQVACREEDVPHVGDTLVYDISRFSILVVRAADSVIKAFHNSCLHRGTQLRATDGPVRELRCPFHGFTWGIDGSFKGMPCEWDFPQIDKDDFDLPEVRVDTWGGFVFVCLDAATPPLAEYLEDVPEHFAPWPLENRWKAAHVGRVVPANWKVALEAFIEAFHVVATHPQNAAVTGDANTQYDVYPGKRHYTRMLTAQAVASPHLGDDVDDELVLRTYLHNRQVSPLSGEQIAANRRDLAIDEAEVARDGRPARAVLAERFRELLTANTGVDLRGISDCETLDAIEYHVFPNLVPWAGFGAPMVYRVRPNGDDHRSSIFEVMLLLPFPEGKRPAPAPFTMLADDAPWFTADELGMLGHVLEQDMDNMRRVQRGLEASATGRVTLGNYQEARIRHYHQTIDWYLAGRPGPTSP